MWRWLARGWRLHPGRGRPDRHADRLGERPADLPADLTTVPITLFDRMNTALDGLYATVDSDKAYQPDAFVKALQTFQATVPQ